MDDLEFDLTDVKPHQYIDKKEQEREKSLSADSAEGDIHDNTNRQDQGQRTQFYPEFGGISQKALDSLRESGLSDEAIVAMRVARPANGQPDDYSLAYFDARGVVEQQYRRVRIFRKPDVRNPKPPKYIQTPTDQPTRIYFPPNWSRIKHGRNYVIFTEGEKKAMSAAQFGFPTIGLGGVDNWQTKKLFIPQKYVKLEPSEKKYVISLSPFSESDKEEDPNGEEVQKLAELLSAEHVYAPGLEDLVHDIALNEKTVFLVYDTDPLPAGGAGTKIEVQRSAFMFANFLLDHGVTDIRFVKLPPGDNNTKMGLDDFIVRFGHEAFEQYLIRPLEEKPKYGLEPSIHNSPSHPNTKFFLKQILDKPRPSRQKMVQLARAVIADLDEHGGRYAYLPKNNSATTPIYFYLDGRSKTLIPAQIARNELGDSKNTAFGVMLQKRYALASRDDAALRDIADHFAIMGGIKYTTPRRVSFASSKITGQEEDALYYQISSGRLVKVTADSISVHDNGFDNVLFLQGITDPLPQTRFMTAETLPVMNRWLEFFRHTNIVPIPGMTAEQTHIFLSCHFYLNPWFRRWRNLMLPIELTKAEPGSGKALTLDTVLLTPTGKMAMRDVQVGTELIGPDGKITKVTGVYPQGKKEVYRVTFRDGVTVECCEDHLWEFTCATWQSNLVNPSKVKTTRELQDYLVKFGHKPQYRPRIPIGSNPVEFDTSNLTPLPLPPYIIGALLGDGSMVGHTTRLTTIDPEILARFYAAGLDICPVNESSKERQYSYNIRGIGPIIKQLGLFGHKSYTKFIPEIYKYRTAEERLELLQGLLDTDGHCGKSKYEIQFSTVSEQLADDVKWLVDSLGGMAIKRLRPDSGFAPNWNVQIIMPEGMNPFYLKRKAELVRTRHVGIVRSIVAIEATGKYEEMQCIAVDNERKLFALDNYVLTHNTTLYQLRKGITTGRFRLDRLSEDVRDWYASVSDHDGLFVADNVGFMPNAVRQQYSDEFARLITDLDPGISMRKLFTTAEEQRFPIDATFAITSIGSPFNNEDLVQRALIINMKAIASGQRNGSILNQQLDNGGRLEWVLNHLRVAQEFFKVVKSNWDDDYIAGHRLVNYEQSILCMGMALGISREQMAVIVRKYVASIQINIVRNNPTMQALNAFAQYIRELGNEVASLEELTNWLTFSDYSTYANNIQYWRKYLNEHTYDVKESVGIMLEPDESTLIILPKEAEDE